MIKRFNPDFSLSISHELAYMRETPEGGYVEYGDYATLFAELETVKAERDALEQRVNALAVENAGLHEAISEIADALETGTDGLLFTAVDNAMTLTTRATSAALAAIRSNGVEQFIAEMLERGNDPTNSLTERVRADMRSAATFARLFIELQEGK